MIQRNNLFAIRKINFVRLDSGFDEQHKNQLKFQMDVCCCFPDFEGIQND